jgi:hypothetical protein
VAVLQDGQLLPKSQVLGSKALSRTRRRKQCADEDSKPFAHCRKTSRKNSGSEESGTRQGSGKLNPNKGQGQSLVGSRAFERPDPAIQKQRLSKGHLQRD